jgi:nitrogen fixation protein FixH
MTGKRVWWYFVAFFGFVAVVNAAMVTLAIRTHSGIVTEHPYEKGLAYNQVVDAEKEQAALGWRGAIDYKNGVLRFVLHDKENVPIPPEKAEASITRPTQQGMDFTVELKGAETALKFPVNGLWEVRVDAEHKGVHYQQSKRIVVE